MALLLLAATGVMAQDVPTEPILRLNAEMHTDRITGVDSDAAGGLLITASSDKTARIWEADTGALVQTLRVPIAEGNEGEVYAVALSPDGETALVGGWTRYGGDSHRLFAFDVERGELLRSVAGFGYVIADIEYSPDGRYVAVATGGSADNVVLDGRSLRVAARLTGYEARSPNVAWAPDGRLATVSYDGAVRLYDREFSRIRRVEPTGGSRPFSLAFSPDGERLAVGFRDSSRLQVLDGRTLRLSYEPDTSGVREGRVLNKVAWSPDGDTLYAGGNGSRRFDGSWRYYVRTWERGGRGAYEDIGVAGNTIHDLEMLPNGSLAVASSNPDLAVLRPPAVFWYTAAPVLSFRSRDRSHFRLSAGGTEVGATPPNEQPFVFDAAGRRFAEEGSDAPAYREAAGGMRVSNWKNSSDPGLNGARLDVLRRRERSRSVDVAPGGDYAILGSNWHLRRIAPDGSVDWEIDARLPWGVNIANGADVVAAAHNGGTIRWYRTEDGRQLLSFFLHADRERWVAWTPSGYYDASPGGEDLIGWHVNRGIDETPDFFPASTFRERFYRPDIVQEILNTLDEEQAIAAANERRAGQAETTIAESLPPTVRITSPRRNAEIRSEELALELSLNAPEDAPVTDLRVMLNGRPVPGRRGLARESSEAGGDERSVTVDLSGVSGEEAVVTVLAANRHGFSPPADVTVRLAGEQFEEFEAGPKLYLLAVGVSDYRDNELDLEYAAKDARDIVSYFRSQAGELYRDVEVRLLTDEEATQDTIEDALFWLEEQVTANDVAKVFVAGHGINDNTGELHYAPYDVDVDRLRRTGVPATDIVDTISYLQGRVVYFMDACHSGNLDFVRRSAGGVDLNGHIQDLSAAENGAVVFSSAAGSQFALESPEWGNGAFTRAMLEAFDGAGDYNDDGAVSVNELNLYVAEEVKALTNNQQTPVLQKPDSIRDFPLGVVQKD
jgi:WD40 repeat protein